MANPATVSTKAGTWVKVLSNRTNGQVFGNDSNANYLITYRDAGDPIPEDTSANRKKALRLDVAGFTVNSSAGIDVYVLADDGAGSVLVF